jgi:excisionase family DNA binding protein
MEIITVPEVAEMLNFSHVKVYKLAKLGKIPAQKVGRCWRFSKQAIEYWLFLNHSLEENMDSLFIDMQIFGKEKGLTRNGESQRASVVG